MAEVPLSNRVADSPVLPCQRAKTKSPAKWDVNCVKKILCKSDPSVVNQLAKTEVKAADVIYYDDPYFNGTKWTTKRFQAGGSADPVSKKIMILSGASCEEAATIFYHEVWHQNQPPGMGWPEPAEDDAYFNTEKWTIENGLPSQGVGLRTKDKAGNITPNRKAIRAMVQKEYPSPPPPVAGVPQPVPIDSDPAGNRTRVRDPITGNKSWRPSKAGDTYAGPETRVGEATIDPKRWKCP